MGSRKKTHFKRTPTLKVKWTLPISGTLLSFAGAQTSNTEYKLINSDKQIRIGDKCASAVDGLGGLLSIADCDTTSTYQQSYYASGGHGSSTKMSTYCMTLEEVQNTQELHRPSTIGRCLVDDCYSLQSPNLGEGGRAGIRSSKTQPTAGGGGGWYSDGQDGLESTNNWPGGDGGISAGSVATGGKFSSHTLRQSYEEEMGGNGGFGGGGSLAGVTGQGGGGGGYTGGNGGHSGTQAARGACPSGGGGGSYIDNFEDNYYLFDGNVESLRTDLTAFFTAERIQKIQDQLDLQEQNTDVRMKGEEEEDWTRQEEDPVRQEVRERCRDFRRSQE